mmetsp:Transcript_20800/g.52782  ORF Transcript_20800/g.52782 Transcript_20800/m.52782 type:complete len:322 (-) Transcript_20800:197-1162(-)
MPAPISPAPSTPTVSMAVAGLPNGFFLHAVWPKNRPCSAPHSGVTASLPKSADSSAEPLAWPPSRPALTTARIAGGAGYFPLVCLSTAVSACENSSARPGGVASNAHSIQERFFFATERLAVPDASALAAAIAVRSSACGSTTRSTRPIFLARSGLIVLPVSIMSSAAAAPMSLGKRWVPPDPGSRPSITSGTASAVLAPEEATRWWQARATSRPPPMQAPLIAATMGVLELAILSMIRCPACASAAASPAVVQAASILMSAPAMKLSGFEEMRTAALTDKSACRLASSSSNSSISFFVSVFIFSPCASSLISATPSASTV